jgi:hypothetical protein
MIDILALSVAHGLLVLAAIRLMARDDLDSEGEPRRGFGARRKPGLQPLDDDGPIDGDGADRP